MIFGEFDRILCKIHEILQVQNEGQMGRCRKEYYVRIVGKKMKRMRIGGADRIGCENSWNMRAWDGAFYAYEFVQVRILAKNMHWCNQYSLIFSVTLNSNS